MTLILRKQHAEDRIEGREPPLNWSDDDYAVVDETLVGRIYRQPVQGDLKWRSVRGGLQDLRLRMEDSPQAYEVVPCDK